MLRSVPSYLLAVLIASATFSLEIFLGVRAAHFAGYSRTSPPPFWESLLASMTLLPFFVFVLAVVIAAIPFILFYPAYRRFHGGDARNLAMLFGVLATCLALEVVLGLLSAVQPRDHFALVGIGLAPGLVGGWVFHRSMVASDVLAKTS